MVEPNEIDELVTATNSDLHRMLGVVHHDDPAQSARRMARDGGVPHIRIGKRFRFSLRAIKQWVAEKLENSAAARDAEAA